MVPFRRSDAKPHAKLPGRLVLNRDAAKPFVKKPLYYVFDEADVLVHFPDGTTDPNAAFMLKCVPKGFPATSAAQVLDPNAAGAADGQYVQVSIDSKEPMVA